jgi:hypothetical protein
VSVEADAPVFSSRILKAGALLGDVRRVVEVWDDGLSSGENLDRIVEGNLLGKPSRSRCQDVVDHAIRPRFVDPGPQVIDALRLIVGRAEAFAQACWYETSRADPLVAAFAEEALFGWSQDGRVGVSVDLVEIWVREQARRGRAPAWSDQVTRRAAHGLVASARDVGILVGNVRKELASPRLSPPGFVYVAFRLFEQGASSRGQVDNTVWRRWLLDPGRVERLFEVAARAGVLRYARVGSSLRLDWVARSLPEAVEVTVAAS